MDPEIKALPVGEAELLRDGSDVALIAIGNMVPVAMEAADELNAQGIDAAVLNARFAKPLDVERITGLARRCGAIVTLEEHSGQGGFGAAVLEVLAAAKFTIPVRHLGVPDQLVEHGETLETLGLDVADIVTSVRSCLGSRETR